MSRDRAGVLTRKASELQVVRGEEEDHHALHHHTEDGQHDFDDCCWGFVVSRLLHFPVDQEGDEDYLSNRIITSPMRA